MLITPITIPATDDIDKLRESIMLAFNRMAGQINRPKSAVAPGLTKADVMSLIGNLRSEVYNIPSTPWDELISITIDGIAVTY